jgi:hypothetical protein
MLKAPVRTWGYHHSEFPLLLSLVIAHWDLRKTNLSKIDASVSAIKN